MNLLIIGLIIFLLLHFIPSFPSLREKLRQALTPKGYKILFSVLSLLGIVLIVFGLKQAPFIELYKPPAWGRHLAMLLMFPAIYCFFSTSLGPAPSSLKVYTANPLNWGVALWAGSHLFANGDVAHVMLFASLLIFSLISIVTSNQRGMQPSLKVRPPLTLELGFVLVVFLMYAVLIWAHVYITGMPLI